ncbi:XRE family transcriptional regulator [Aliarcobacter butzleri]|uniref:XRE family transcriptional regulator n=1 Tax=Aliarcobacter butzleri TaxID=28197 RepID=UPI00263E6EC9|nr:XRE family transcriptional regulator [Aliarcobacter butzleri]MDN5088137.1 XRE family transcriptional regulator [Aliarcobacter butzleri]
MENIEFTEEMLLGFYECISKNIIRIRKEKKVSQLKLANAIGHQNATFLGKAELLAEGKHFNLEHIYKISLVLNIDINEFFKK